MYSNANTEYPAAKAQVVLDPFMGGGTTVVEALRIGFSAVGVDLNPLAWFIGRNECTAVDLAELDAAYERVRAAVESKVAELYVTRYPRCSDPAQVMYAFWAKVANCRTCRQVVEIREPFLVWVWECKAYGSRIPVDDVEEFHAKLGQIGVNRVKGTIAARGNFQAGTIAFVNAGINSSARRATTGVCKLTCGQVPRWPFSQQSSPRRAATVPDENCTRRV